VYSVDYHPPLQVGRSDCPPVKTRRIPDPACAWGSPLRWNDYTIRHSIHQALIVAGRKWLTPDPRHRLDRAVGRCVSVGARCIECRQRADAASV